MCVIAEVNRFVSLASVLSVKLSLWDEQNISQGAVKKIVNAKRFLLSPTVPLAVRTIRIPLDVKEIDMVVAILAFQRMHLLTAEPLVIENV